MIVQRIVQREKNKNCVKAETETYKIQKPVPNTLADLIRYAVSFWIFSGFSFKIMTTINGIYSKKKFRCNIKSRSEIFVTSLCNTSSNILQIRCIFNYTVSYRFPYTGLSVKICYWTMRFFRTSTFFYYFRTTRTSMGRAVPRPLGRPAPCGPTAPPCTRKRWPRPPRRLGRSWPTPTSSSRTPRTPLRGSRTRKPSSLRSQPSQVRSGSSGTTRSDMRWSAINSTPSSNSSETGPGGRTGGRPRGYNGIGLETLLPKAQPATTTEGQPATTTEGTCLGWWRGWGRYTGWGRRGGLSSDVHAAQKCRPWGTSTTGALRSPTTPLSRSSSPSSTPPINHTFVVRWFTTHNTNLLTLPRICNWIQPLLIRNILPTRSRPTTRPLPSSSPTMDGAGTRVFGGSRAVENKAVILTQALYNCQRLEPVIRLWFSSPSTTKFLMKAFCSKIQYVPGMGRKSHLFFCGSSHKIFFKLLKIIKLQKKFNLKNKNWKIYKFLSLCFYLHHYSLCRCSIFFRRLRLGWKRLLLQETNTFIFLCGSVSKVLVCTLYYVNVIHTTDRGPFDLNDINIWKQNALLWFGWWAITLSTLVTGSINRRVNELWPCIFRDDVVICIPAELLFKLAYVLQGFF